MNFTDIFIRRPVLACVLSLLLLVTGLKAFTGLQLRQHPEITYPAINVTTVYPGASAALMKGFVTTPVLSALSSAEGIAYMTATSTDSTSVVTAFLTPDYDVDSAFLEVSAKVNKVRTELPRESENPLVEKMESASGDILQYISFVSEVMSQEQITDYLSKVVLPEINTIEGVSQAQIRGKRTFAMRIWLDSERMASLGLSTDDIESALARNNYQSAAGKIDGEFVRISVTADTDLNSREEFEDIVVRGNGQTLIRMKDIARVELGAEHYRDVIRYGGQRTVFVQTTASASANPVEVAANVRAALPDLEKQLPPELKMEVVFDTTVSIEKSIEEVLKTLVEASIIVVLVILVFLGNLRSVLVPMVTIPLSLVGVMVLMLMMGFSLNLLTLLAMVLAIGLVVDDAIVVLENIQRHMEEGESRYQAALKGAREIAFPVIAMTFTLAAVYGPVGFLEGLTGALFTEFAFTLAAAVIVSGVVALTLSPMMCSRMLPEQIAEGRFSKSINSVLDGLTQLYLRALDEAIKMRWLTVLFCAVILSCIYFLYDSIAQELAPMEDDGVVVVTGTGPIDANADYMEKYVAQTEKPIAEIPERERSFFWVSDSNVFSLVLLSDWDERERTAKEIQDSLLSELNKVTGLQLYTYNFPPLPGAAGGLPMQYVLTSTLSDELLFQVADRVREEASKSGLFTYISQDLKFNKPELVVNIDRSIAGEMGVSMEDIGRTLSTYLGEANSGRFSVDNRSYKVIAQADAPFRLNPEALANYHVPAVTGEMVPLSTFVSTELRSSPNKLSQFQQLNATYIGAMLAPGVSMGQAIEYMDELSERALPDGFGHDYMGQARQFLEEGNVLVATFGFSVLLIYLVLAAQFESFRDPIIVLISVPMSICGALIPLALGLSTMNIYSQIGLITLIGLISKHGILIVDFANNLQESEGLSVREAAKRAAAVRLRPILMTTAAMVFGVLPLLMASGAGAQSRFSIGLVITAGMSIGTLFTLFAVPVLYTFFARVRKPLSAHS
ncbi:multidrug efflux pump [Litorivivens lipolytica]|uniref:Multidrug efflux pump n=1 Tax=Litorivivens lipolytica TaxID=1524264 RepID=A0A7W4Z4M7_9GAMM|nr:efflux RND transporter permease subunit [Litorivivens lipolytica]MBB3046654.1 multidrug efflux pump [Litorivivens lipolytica]